MKWIKKCPLLAGVLATAAVFTILAVIGKNNIYSGQELNLLKAPVLSVLFTGLNDGIYPWQVLDREAREAAAMQEGAQGSENPKGSEAGSEEGSAGTVSPEDSEAAGGSSAGEGGSEAAGGSGVRPEGGETVSGNSVRPEESETVSGNSVSEEGSETVSGNSGGREDEEAKSGEAVSNSSERQKRLQDEAYSIQDARLAPLRESTREEYLNHISADIYGEAGVVRAASYAFEQVDESYFDDALFIGDSRTVGLRDYTDLKEHADFLCETSLTVYKVMEESFKGQGTVEEVLAAGDYGKIYLMVGINELGRGTTEDFMAKYTEVVDRLHELEPEATIFIQGIMRVSGEKNSSDAIFNNSNINARNNAIATLADNVQVFYIDVNEAVCDEAGNLEAEYTFDQIHLLGMYNDLWKQFLLSRGVN